MKIKYHRTFQKNFKKRILPHLKLVAKFKERLNLKLKDPTNPLLKNHRLKGEKSKYLSFSISGDIRVIYQIKDEVLLLYDIGTHNQVY